MARPTTTLRFLAGLLAPGGVLLLAAWALTREDVVWSAAAPYVPFFCFGALATAVLLSWYFDQARLLSAALVVGLSSLALAQWPADVAALRLLVVLLLPINLGLFAALEERGVLTLEGLLKLAAVSVQTAAVIWIAGQGGPAAAQLAIWADRLGARSWLPWSAQAAAAAGALVILVVVFRQRTKVEQGLLWTLAAAWMGYRMPDQTDTLFLYAGTAGLVLVFAVLEHGYDIAYRDELTGLPGRRAFNDNMSRLTGTYSIAMCDVDHFKQFNDTYGHDAGDQVLRMVAGTLGYVGGGGRAFRYGGEEFLIVFPGLTAREAEPFVDATRGTIAATQVNLRTPDQPSARITVSMGLAERSTRHSTPELVLDAADAALYRAKQAGRNCVKVDESTPA